MGNDGSTRRSDLGHRRFGPDILSVIVCMSSRRERELALWRRPPVPLRSVDCRSVVMARSAYGPRRVHPATFGLPARKMFPCCNPVSAS